MKQKGTKKSLLLSKEKNFKSLTGLLIATGIVFIGAVFLLISHSANAQENKTVSVAYSGIDNANETIYDLSFIASDPATETVNKMYLNVSGNDTTFIISGNSVVSNAYNSNSTIINSNILGGSKYNIHSANITILGGMKSTNETTVINEGNDNATILGTVDNKGLGEGTNNTSPVVLIGGKSNQVQDNQNGNVILGGNDNSIKSHVTNGQIYGGKNSQISNYKEGVTVAGSNVQVNNSNNIFVFNNKNNFTPETSNAFYINSKEGLGLNGDSNGDRLLSSGAVSISIGSPYINEGGNCNGKEGQMGYNENGCLYGCSNGEWKLLSLTEECGYEPAPGPNPGPNPDDKVEGKCTIDNPDPNAHRCDGLDPTRYWNITYKTILVGDSESDCPKNINAEGTNQCTYICNKGYSLYTDGKCHKDCEGSYPEGGTRYMKHGTENGFYFEAETTCPSESCNHQFKTCEDGKLKGNSQYKHKDGKCIVNPKSKPAGRSYNIPPAHHDYNESCAYRVTNNRCICDPIYQDLGCESGYHEDETGVCVEDCNIDSCEGYNITSEPSGGKYESCTPTLNTQCDKGSTVYKCSSSTPTYTGGTCRYCAEYNGCTGKDILPGKPSSASNTYETCAISHSDCSGGETNYYCAEGYHWDGDNKCIPIETCGNGVLDADEVCDYNDPSEQNWGDGGCDSGCNPINNCGNGIIDEGEQCDPADTSKTNWGNGCSESCEKTCIESNCSTALYTLTTKPSGSEDTYQSCTPINKQCSEGTTAYKCKDNYQYNSSTNTCEPTQYKCIGDRPTHSNINNINKSPTTDTEYFYSDQDLACAYSCEPGYHGEKCEANQCKNDNPEHSYLNNTGAIPDINNKSCFKSIENVACAFTCQKWWNAGDKCDGVNAYCGIEGYTCMTGDMIKTPDTDSSTTWNCIAANTVQCTACKTGYEKDENGVCQPINLNPCPSTLSCENLGACGDGFTLATSTDGGTAGSTAIRTVNSTVQKDLNDTAGGLLPVGEYGVPTGVTKNGDTYSWKCTSESLSGTCSVSCAECKGNPPSGSEYVISSNTSPTLSTGYHYSTNTSEACSYSCANGYYHVGNGKCCANGEQYLCNECRSVDRYERKFFDRYGNEITEYTYNLGPVGTDYDYEVLGVSFDTKSLNSWCRSNGSHWECSTYIGMDLDSKVGLPYSFAREKWVWEIGSNTLNGTIIQNGTNVTIRNLSEYSEHIPVLHSISGNFDHKDKDGVFGIGSTKHLYLNIGSAGYSWIIDVDNYNVGDSITIYPHYDVAFVSDTIDGFLGLKDHVAAFFERSPSDAYFTAKVVPVYNTSCGSTNTSGNGNSSGNGGGRGGGCFLPGTPVLTDQGYKDIDKIQAGEKVLSYNEDTKEYEYNTVLEQYIHPDNTDDLYEITFDGHQLLVTSIHAFYTVRNNEYQCNPEYQRIQAKNLQIGDKILMYDGTYATVENSKHQHYRGTVYNLNVKNAHTYFVGEGYLVHNAAYKEQYVNNNDTSNCYTIVDATEVSSTHVCN